MRVLHVIPAIAPRYGGPSAAVLGMCRAVRAKGASTLIATTDADGAGRLPVTLSEATTYEDLPAIFFRRRFSESFKWSANLGAWLTAHVAEFDVVHVHAVFSHSSISAGQACVTAGVPYVVRPLGTLDPWSVNRKAMRKQVLFRIGVDDLLRRASAIHYTTAEEQRLAETVVARLPRGVVIPIGIDDQLFAARESRPGAPPYVLALSRLEAKKGLELLIRSFQHASADRPEWRLIIAGDGDPDYVSSLKKMAVDSERATRIEFRGWVTGQEKAALLGGASLFALVSHQENFGIALAEAMAMGVPALVTPGVNLSPEIQTAQAGWVVDQAEDRIAEGLAAAMRDGSGRAHRGRAARMFASRFRWPSIGDELLTLYINLSTPPAVAAETSSTRLA